MLGNRTLGNMGNEPTSKTIYTARENTLTTLRAITFFADFSKSFGIYLIF